MIPSQPLYKHSYTEKATLSPPEAGFRSLGTASETKQTKYKTARWLMMLPELVSILPQPVLIANGTCVDHNPPIQSPWSNYLLLWLSLLSLLHLLLLLCFRMLKRRFCLIKLICSLINFVKCSRDVPEPLFLGRDIRGLFVREQDFELPDLARRYWIGDVSNSE